MQPLNVMKKKTNLPGLEYLLANEHFITCHLLSSDQFIDYCKKRGVATSREHLEQYERLKLFYPIARVKYFKFKVKVESIGGNLAEGLLWEPSSRRYQSWKKFRSRIGETIVESFYSIFQCHTLHLLNQWTTFKLGLQWWPPYGKRSIE
jgi:hypothetical protein